MCFCIKPYAKDTVIFIRQTLVFIFPMGPHLKALVLRKDVHTSKKGLQPFLVCDHFLLLKTKIIVQKLHPPPCLVCHFMYVKPILQ